MIKGKRYKSLYLPALTIVATVVTLLIVIAVSTYRNISRERERIEDSLRREGLVIIRAIEAGVGAGSPANRPNISRIKKIVEEVSHEPAIASILLFNDEGNLILSVPGREEERVKDALLLGILLKEKGIVTRYHMISGEERSFEVIKPFRPFSYKDPLAFARGAEEREEVPEEPWYPWAKDKVISVSLSLGAFERARQEDIHHAFLMGAILVVLGTGALYFIFIVQNYYLVDRSLAQMKSYTENVVESMADGLISIDNEKKIVTLNRKAREILGATEEELKGRIIYEVLGQDVERILQSARQKVTIREQEMGLPQQSGKEIPMSLSATPLKDEMGREMGLVFLLRDLREIRSLQEKVRRSERLSSLGRLAAGVAHEIRNPLSSIRGFAQYFMHRFQSQEEEQGYASVMVKEVDRLNRVITELLDYARPKDPRREPHSLENIMDHSLKLLEPELVRRKVDIEREFEPSLPDVLTDRDQISQAFLNLLLNSLESMDGGGKIRICLKKGRIRPSVEVSIADTGRGIASEDLGKVFEPFFSTKNRGTGLGLAIVHQIVESHGGDIEVESQQGMGTTFRITLPTAE
jgi:two-component system sensor histidine kinase HydH